MKKIIWIFLIVFVGGYSACRWDYHLSMYYFNKICADKEKVGMFIYEKIELGEECFIPFIKGKDPRGLDQRFVLNGDLIISQEQFKKDYIFEVYKKIPLSEVGPISFMETSVIRRSDSKLLGKAISLHNGRGWLMKKLTSSFGGGGESCPIDQYSRNLSYFRRNHDDLIKNIFILQKN